MEHLDLVSDLIYSGDWFTSIDLSDAKVFLERSFVLLHCYGIWVVRSSSYFY